MPIDINKHEVDIENLFKQNENDLCSIKELYRKIEELGNRITKIKYIDTTLANKLKNDYEKIKRTFLDEINSQLDNRINEINSQLDNSINEINSQIDNIANKGTTVEVLERVTKEEIERQIQDGTIGNLIIADEINKLNIPNKVDRSELNNRTAKGYRVNVRQTSYGTGMSFIFDSNNDIKYVKDDKITVNFRCRYQSLSDNGGLGLYNTTNNAIIYLGNFKNDSTIGYLKLYNASVIATGTGYIKELRFNVTPLVSSC